MEKITIENEFQTNKSNEYEINYIIDDKFIKPIISFSFIYICENCQCYSKHTLFNNSIFSKCHKCQKEYCLGCSVEKYSSDNNKLCLRRYINHLYLRMKYENERENDFEIMEYIFIFVITIFIIPIYLPLISSFCYFNRHPNKPIDENNIKVWYIEIYKTVFPQFFPFYISFILLVLFQFYLL